MKLLRYSTAAAIHELRRADAEGKKPVKERAPKKQPKSSQLYLYGWGLAAVGALAEPEFVIPRNFNRQLTYTHKPCRIGYGNLLSLQFVSSGFGFSLFATNRSNPKHAKVFAAGLNVFSQLGFHPSKKDANLSMKWLIYPKPVQLNLTNQNSKIIGIACGRSHSLIATEEGLLTMGNNSLGQCGRPVIEQENCLTKKDIVQSVDLKQLQGSLENDPIIQVVCGLDTSFILMESGNIYSFGLGTDGQLGNGTLSATHQPQKVVGDVDGEKIIRIACVADTVLAVSEKGDMFGWGNNEYGQLSSVSGETQVAYSKHLPVDVGGRVLDVAAGGSSCAVVNDVGEVYVWGYGILGQGPQVERLERPSLLPAPLFGNCRVQRITAGCMHFGAVTDTGELYTWGRNRFGVLGLGHDKDQYFPFKVSVPFDVRYVALGPDHTMALTSAI